MQYRKLASTTRDADGTRRTALYRLAAGVPVGGFRDKRVPASLDRVSDTVIELTCSRTPAAGSYAVSVNEEAFELNVR